MYRFNLFSGEYAWHTRHHRPFVAPEPGHTEHAAAPPKHRAGATRAIINESPATAASPSPSPHSMPPLSFRSITSAGLRLLVLLGLTMPSQIQCSCAPAINLFLSLSFPFVSYIKPFTTRAVHLNSAPARIQASALFLQQPFFAFLGLAAQCHHRCVTTLLQQRA